MLEHPAAAEVRNSTRLETTSGTFSRLQSFLPSNPMIAVNSLCSGEASSGSEKPVLAAYEMSLYMCTLGRRRTSRNIFANFTGVYVRR